jgi:hypothetical protein
MLRDMIGDDAFHRGIRLFWERHKFKVASWDDLRADFEQAAGRPLKAFFEEWVERAGGPALDIEQAKAQTVDGKTKLALTLTQTAPAYALRVPLEIVTGSHSEMRWVDFDRERQVVTLALDAMPDGVRLDPNLHLWRVLDREQLPPILRRWIIARAPRLAIVSNTEEAVLAAKSLARSFFETPAKLVSPAEILDGNEPTLIVGLQRDVDATLSRLGLAPRPAILTGRGSAQVWTVRSENGGAPIAVISAHDAASLVALLRPLPHYGAQSYLIFDGRRTIARGIWPAPGRLIAVTRVKSP